MPRHLLIFLLALFSLNADTQKNTQESPYAEEYEEYDDLWFGPGFYYGIWFESEPNYWEWRNDHPDYPSNRNYYNKDHPVEYHPEEHERMPENRGEEHYRGGGGMHGGRGR